jgi:type VII secretion-associated serine protease mycosin
VALPANPARADNIRNDQWYLKSLHIAQAQKISTGAGVTVAVVDTGTFPHQDLRKNLLKGADFTPTGGADGYQDQQGHGTAMAGLIAAHGKSATSGVLGIAPNSHILPIRAVVGTTVDADRVGRGIEFGTNHGAKVINISAVMGPAFALLDSVHAAIAADVVVVAGVGNTSTGGEGEFPAAMDGVLAVGAVDKDNKHASFSIKDPKVAICAPGVDIRVASPNNKYTSTKGTSDATAIVSGAVALVRSKFPTLSGPDVIHRLTATADDIGPPGRDNECGFGVLNIVKALTANVPPLAEKTPSASPSTEATTTPPTTTPTTDVAAPAQQNSSASGSGGSGLVIGGGIVAGLALVGGLLFVANRRRRRQFGA